MKMTRFEKHFINSRKHTAQVAHRARQLLDRIDVRAGRRYLDVGCGVGAAAFEIAEGCGLEVTGIDVDPGQIEAARAAHPHLRFMVMDAAKLQFHDAEFHIVTTSMVMHHMPDWERAFSEMIRVLRPGGHLILSDLMLPSWLAVTGRRLVPFTGFPSAKRIESIASRSGLTKLYRSRAGLRFDFIWLRDSRDRERQKKADAPG